MVLLPLLLLFVLALDFFFVALTFLRGIMAAKNQGGEEDSLPPSFSFCSLLYSWL